MTPPPAIATFYRRCVPQPPEAVRGTLIEQVGEMRLAPNKPWMQFTAKQWFEASRTAFNWRAHFRMAPLLNGVVVDAYEAGHGRLDAKLWGLLPIARGRGPKIDHGEVQRYLAELPWNPTALMHNPELRFAELADGAVRVWCGPPNTYVDLRFDAQGDIVAAYTDTRYRDGVQCPWEGRFSEYAEFDGVRVPAKAEVAWETPQGRYVYWRGQVVAFNWLR